MVFLLFQVRIIRLSGYLLTLENYDNQEKLMINARIAKTEDIEKISHLLATSWKTAYRGIVDDDYLDSLSYDHWVNFLTTALNGEAIFAMALYEMNMSPKIEH